MKSIVKVTVFLLLSAVCSIAAFQTAELILIVVDVNGDTVADVKVRLSSSDKPVKEFNIPFAENFPVNNLEPGIYVLDVKADGFEPYQESFEVKAGINRKRIVLKVAEIKETVEVEQDKQDKSIDPRDGAFTGFLTKAELDALPEDPEALKKVLREKFGEGAEFLVDGFSSDGLPPASQIASIRVSQTSYDAEYHTPGVTRIEITVKASTRWRGIFATGFQDESLNAREPFSPIRQPEQLRSFSAFISGPLRNKSSSFNANISSQQLFSTNTITAILPEGDFINALKSPVASLSLGGKILHNLSPYQTFNLGYSYTSTNSKNLGIGGFDLPERAFNLNLKSHQIRYSQTGNVGERFYNEFRLQYQNDFSETVSKTQTPALIVLDAFTGGGAGNDLSYRKNSLIVGDNFLFGIKNHAVKIGGLFEYEYQQQISSRNENGTFTFSSLNDFVRGMPSTFTQSLGTRRITTSQLQIAGFIQDDIRIGKGVLLNLGLRYEWQNNLHDFNNFSPRLGVSWSPLKDGRLVFRAGAGLFYNWLDTRVLARVRDQGFGQPGEITIINPGFPDAFSGGTFEILPPSFRLIASDLQNPSVFFTQFGADTRLSERSSFRVLYTYRKGIHQFRSRNLNAPGDSVRPDENQGNIFQIESSAFFVQNSVKVIFETTPTKKTHIFAQYELSRFRSDAEGAFSLPSNNFNLRGDLADSDNDQRHRIRSSLGWTPGKEINISIRFSAASPRPYTITTGTDINGDTIFNDRPQNILRNSARGTWTRQFDSSFRWAFSLEKNEQDVTLGADGGLAARGKTLFLTADITNIFNNTNFNSFVGVQTSPLFTRPNSASEPRKINLGLVFIF